MGICEVHFVAGSWLHENASIDMVCPEHYHRRNKGTLSNGGLYRDYP